MTKNSRRVAKMRRALLTLSLVLVVAFAAVGGTIAWLTDTTTEIVNTFAPTGIDIDLTETQNNGGQPFDLIPNKEYAKNPIVSVVRPKTDVDVYLFVKFEEVGNPATYLDYTSTLTTENNWALVPGTTNVWYREVKATDSEISWNLLADNKVTVKNLTKTDMPAENAVSLEYTAYAIQTSGFDSVETAWAEASKL